MSSTQTDAPSWVQADAACRQAWGRDRQWRKAARCALAPTGRAPGDGGTTGDVLLREAWRRARSSSASKDILPAAGRSGAQHHAQECICPTCCKARGQYVPTLRQLQERRKRRIGAAVGQIGYEPGDAEGWLLTEHDAVRWARVVDALRDARDKITHCDLRPEWLAHLDKLLRTDALEQLWQNHPHLARAFTGCALDGRTQDDVARAEGCARSTISRRVKEAKDFLARRLGAG
jgi:DNA-directed RNA polymerase specialized sigma24 family protein